MELTGAVVMVFGGASGLGAATVAGLAQAGAAPFIADVNPPPDPSVPHAVCDIRNSEQVQAAIDAAREAGPVRAAVQCAGILRAAKVVSRKGVHPLELFQQVIDINLVGAFNVCRLVAAAMVENPANPDGERGVLIQTASIAAWEGQVGQAAYSASKAGVAGMILPLARELGGSGIRVMGIAPGVFETPMMQAAPEDVRTALTKQIPFPKRFGHPSEYAALVRHILENPMLNGSVLRLDGAIRMN
jgi:NAD(P)-dependent dehydrogenase (short-subunit alcohol dehydrogenase family)